MEKIGVISDSALTGWTSKLKRPMLRAPTTLLQSPAVLALRKVLEAWSKESDTQKQDVHKVWCMWQTSRHCPDESALVAAVYMHQLTMT